MRLDPAPWAIVAPDPADLHSAHIYDRSILDQVHVRYPVRRCPPLADHRRIFMVAHDGPSGNRTRCLVSVDCSPLSPRIHAEIPDLDDRINLRAGAVHPVNKRGIHLQHAAVNIPYKSQVWHYTLRYCGAPILTIWCSRTASRVSIASNCLVSFGAVAVKTTD